jgi:hypothetical protein
MRLFFERVATVVMFTVGLPFLAMYFVARMTWRGVRHLTCEIFHPRYHTPHPTLPFHYDCSKCGLTVNKDPTL